MNLELSLVALFYNEEDSVETVVRDGHRVLKAMGIPFEIVAVQNGSTDRTPEVLARLDREFEELRLVVVPVNRGAGYGALKGWYAAAGNDVVGVSGDGQVDLELIPKLFQLKRHCNGDVAYGRRNSRPDGLKRAFISKTYNLLMRWVFQLKSKDVNGLPKIVSRKVLEAMALKSEDQFLECEMMLKAQRMGLAICSLDVQFHQRQGGISSVGWEDCWDFLRNLTMIGICSDDPWGLHRIPKACHRATWLHYPNGISAETSAASQSLNLQSVASAK